jgi:hypothetical protein
MPTPQELPLERFLEDDETVWWRECPQRGLLWRSVDAILVPFSLLWLAASAYLLALGLSSEEPELLGTFALPFVLAGLWFLIGRFFADARRRRNTQYALTDRRLLVWDRRHRDRPDSVPVPDPERVRVVAHGNGRESWYLPPHPGPDGKKPRLPYALERIAEGDRLRELLAGHPSRAASPARGETP